MFGRNSLIVISCIILAGIGFTSLMAQTEDDGLISRICLVLNSNRIDDGTFNQSAYEGMTAIADDYMLLATETTFLPSETADDHGPNIQKCLDEGYDIIITTGFPLADLTLIAAEENPDRFFIGVDQFVADGPENYVGIQFRDDEAGYLVGYLAGLVTESNIIGAVYGPPIPPLVRWRNGFEQGINLAAEETEKDIIVLGEYLDDFILIEEGEATAAEFIEAGADVIFGAGGLTGSAAIKYAAQAGVWVIGVDQDEYYTTFEGGEADGADRLITSAIKRVSVGVYDMLSVLLDGDLEAFPGGSNYILTVENSGISYANPHDADIPTAYFDQLLAVEVQLAEGEISTGVDPITGKLLDDLGLIAESTPDPEATEAATEEASDE